MKKTVLLLLLIQSYLNAQIDTAIYYPLEIGNYWEYVDIFSGETSRTLVIGDTILSNGKHYFIIDYFGSKEFFRIQDNKYVYRNYPGNCINNEYLMYDFSVHDSSIWPVCLDLPSDGESHLGLSETYTEYFSIFNQSFETKVYEPVKVIASDTCWNDDCTIFFREYVSKGVGLTRVHVELGGDNRLVGAVINGKKYGSVTLLNNRKDNLLPTEFNIKAYPNPFNSSTKITLELPSSGNLDVKVYDILGREVISIFNGDVLTGIQRFNFDAKSFASGTYIITAIFNKSFLSRKVLYLK